MKIFFWIFLGALVLLTPLFIYDMVQRQSINISFVLMIILCFVFYTRAFKAG
ncbi:hypothetical protein JCM19038_1557 [Geomicrobium sp. JCM 19038]|nr:hypothetical protein JCM19038_1557 [Geomicrobium sp. JCM 19038]